MKVSISLAALVAGAAALPQAIQSSATGTPVSSGEPVPTNTLVADEQPVPVATPCAGNDATDRTKWCEFDINSNYYEVAPDTQVTRTYSFAVATATMAPDGVPMHVMAINGQIPGPTINADWGDWIEVHLQNDVATNGTGIHFHGFHQKGTFQDDGVPAITQCPLAPGDSQVYKFRATQYGSSWYHSHWSLQAWNGVFGAIEIGGPSSYNYDEDLGTVILNDWAHHTADQQQLSANLNPVYYQDNGLINGTNTYTLANGTEVGKRFETVFEKGKSYRLRLVNAAIDSYFSFSIDSHTMVVMAADFVPIEPYHTDSVSLTMGQRYDVVIQANQPEGDYWMRSVPQLCGYPLNPQNIKGVVRYNSASTAMPTNTANKTQEICHDEHYGDLRPVVKWDTGLPNTNTTYSATFYQRPDNGHFLWKLGSTTMIVPWERPSIQAVYDQDFAFEEQEAVIVLPNANEWFELVIYQNQGHPLQPAHPIHLHGHDFHILAQGFGNYTEDIPLNRVNPPRRDTADLPAHGYLVIAFLTDNPGIWLMHCHIGYHTFEGFGLQFVERQAEIPPLIDAARMEPVCDNWNNYTQSFSIEQHESGI